MMIKNKKIAGFTLLEVLIVVVIIGILATIVIVILSSTRNKANKSSALSVASSALPELISCQTDTGFGDSDAITVGQTICCDAAGSGCTLAGARPGHAVAWPSLGANTGWAYGTSAGDLPTGTLATNDYIFKIVKTGETAISCNIATQRCQ